MAWVLFTGSGWDLWRSLWSAQAAPLTDPVFPSVWHSSINEYAALVEGPDPVRLLVRSFFAYSFGNISRSGKTRKIKFVLDPASLEVGSLLEVRRGFRCKSGRVVRLQEIFRLDREGWRRCAWRREDRAGDHWVEFHRWIVWQD